MLSVFKSIRKINIRVEVPLFFVIFSNAFGDPVNANFIIYRTCYIALGYNKSDCALLGKDYSNEGIVELEQKVQPYATHVLTAAAGIQAVFPTLMSFFMGPWSDMYGRKLVLLSTVGSWLASFLSLLIVSIITSASPWYFLIFTVPHCLTGGMTAFVTAGLCYISDTIEENRRGLRMGVFEVVQILATVLGTTITSFVFNAWGYVGTYAICVSCNTVAFLYTIFLIPESVKNVKTDGKLRNIFRFSLLTSTIKTTFKKRKNNERSLLFITLALMFLTTFTHYGNEGVLYLYLRRRFTWTLQKYTLYFSIINVANIVGAIFGVLLLHKQLHIMEVIVMLLGVASAFFSSLFQGLAGQNWQIYVAGIMKFLQGSVIPMIRYYLSKLVVVQDSGKVFSLLTVLATLGALSGIATYTNIYNLTLSSFPQSFSFVSVGIYTFEAMLIIIMLIRQRSGTEELSF